MITLSPGDLRVIVNALKLLSASRFNPQEWELMQRLGLELSKAPRPIHNITLEPSDDATVQTNAQRQP